MMFNEKRRSLRIIRNVPLALSAGNRTVDVQSAVISGVGALILSPISLPVGTSVTLLNRRTGAQIEGSVVWDGAEEVGLAFKLGIEFSGPSEEFWGEDYPASIP